MKRVLYILLSVMLLAVSFAEAGAQTDKREVRKGNRSFKDGSYTEAEVEYLKAVDKDSLSVAANYNLANTYFRKGEYDNAKAALERAREVAMASPDGAQYFYNLGSVAIAQQDWKTAVEALQLSLLMNPDDLNAKENYIYAKKKLEDQQQNHDQNQDQNQDNQDQNQDNQDNQNDQNQDQNQDNQDQQQDQNDQNQDQNDDQNQNDQSQDNQDQQQDNRQGEQPQITPQAAQQMLQAIQAKEKETQDKVNKAKAAAVESRQKEKNW